MREKSRKKPALFKSADSKKAEMADQVKKTRIRVIGVGGGAGNVVSELSLRLKKASFVVANTDLQALKQLRKGILTFEFGRSLTSGLGTGMNTELARTAALSEKERIKKLFEGYDLLVLVSCLGGGAGSGAAPVFATSAKNAGLLTLGVFTLPFKFEGEKKQELAREALLKLRSCVNAFVVLPNDRIFQVIEKNTPLQEALSFVNKSLTDGLEGLLETIYLPGLINIDFADLKTVLQGHGRIAYLATAKTEGPGGVQEALQKVLNSPLYPYTIRGAKSVLFNIVGGKDLALAEVSEISKLIFEQAFSQAQIIFGVSQREKSQDRIKVFLLATGCQAKGVVESIKGVHCPPGIFSNNNVNQPQRKKVKRKKRVRPEPKPKAAPEHLPQKAKPKPQKPKPKFKPRAKKVKITVSAQNSEEKPRKNALQIKEETAVAEKEFLEKEKFWEQPAFLRKQKT